MIPFRANLLYPFQYEAPRIPHNEKRPHQFFYLFFEILVIVQGGKNMLGELAMDNLVIMSAFDNLMKVLETLLKEGRVLLFVNFWCSLLFQLYSIVKLTSKQNWDIPLNFGFLN